MTSRSQRRAFTTLMALLAPAFAVGIMAQKFARQADIVSDTIKISLLLMVCTALVAFVTWTIIIPLPAFGWSLKTEVLNLFQSEQSGLFVAILKSLWVSIKWGLLTFVDITKASLIAVIGSSAVGAIIAHYVPAKSPQTT